MRETPITEPTPLDNFVVVTLLEPETKTKGGIHIPETAQDLPLQGVILFKGPNVEHVHIDDKVIYGKYAGNEFTYKGQQVKQLRETDLFMIVPDFEDFKKYGN